MFMPYQQCKRIYRDYIHLKDFPPSFTWETTFMTSCLLFRKKSAIVELDITKTCVYNFGPLKSHF